jgi:hypothetical protein
MQNKANFQNPQMRLNILRQKVYGNRLGRTLGQNKPNFRSLLQANGKKKRQKKDISESRRHKQGVLTAKQPRKAWSKKFVISLILSKF